MEKKKVGILCAGDDEFAPVREMMGECRVSERAMLRFYEGKIEGTEVVSLFSGVCKVNAAVAAQLLIDVFGCGAIINAGTAGAVSAGLDVFSTVVSVEAAYHDVEGDILTDFHPWMPSVWFRADEELLFAASRAAEEDRPEYSVVFGRMVTGECFVGEDEKDRIRKEFAPLTVDMETAGIAHVCYVNRIPFIAVRTITDHADGEGQELFEKNCLRASGQSADFVRRMLRYL